MKKEKANAKTKIGIVGLGKMGEALARAWSKRGYHIAGSLRSHERHQALSKDLGIQIYSSNKALVSEVDIVVLAVKPHQAEEVLKSISKSLRKDQVLVSICAAITLRQLRDWSSGFKNIIRVMPNLPALVGEGMTVVCGEGSPSHSRISDLFTAVGQVISLDEELMDAATGLSACGPAFIFLILEALSEAGVKVGIPRKASTLLAAQTMLGSAQMVLKGGHHPAALKDEVTTPAGCTTDGLMALEEGRLRATLIKAVVAATEKSATLRRPSH